MRQTLLMFLTLFALAALPLAQQTQQDFEAMMKEYMEKYAMPGEHHKHLEQLAGKWATVAQFWPAPGAPAMESTGTAEHEMILGGRFLRTTYESEMMDQKFSGTGTAGYDRYTKQYVETWVDSMGTMTLVSQGTCEQEGRVRTLRAEFEDPMMQRSSYLRSVYRITGPDQYVLEGYGPAPDGKEYMMMEIRHTRVP